jgi:hypothetical protein
MVKHLQTQAESLYGLPQPIVNQFPKPIIARRDPTPSDTGYPFAQIWDNTVAGTIFALASNSGGIASWLSLGGSFTPVVGALTVTGAATALHFVTSTAATSTDLTGNIWSAIGTNAAIDLVLTPKGAGGVIVSSGDLTVTAGNISLANGNLDFDAPGTGLGITEGANATLGTAALVAGTQSIAIAIVDANTRVFLSRCALNASLALGFLIADTSVPGTLTVTSYDATGVAVATDISSFNYLCVEGL